MIQRDSSMRVLRCDICEEQLAVTRGVASNPESMAIAAEEMSDDHRECSEYKDDLTKARQLRAYRKRIARELKTPARAIEPHAALRFGTPILRVKR
jgi:hypothetical protein